MPPSADRRHEGSDVNSSENVDRTPGCAKRIAPALLPSARATSIGLLGTVLIAVAMLTPPPALAIDGCQIPLWLAAPTWRQISQWVPTIHQLHRDTTMGQSFPTCSVAWGGNSANNTWASAPTNCPPLRIRAFDRESGPVYSCDYSGAVTVSINGTAFTRSWGIMAGDSVTEFTLAAKAQLGYGDTGFDEEHAMWLAGQRLSAPPCPIC